jgi:hypothetical protein
LRGVQAGLGHAGSGNQQGADGILWHGRIFHSRLAEQDKGCQQKQNEEAHEQFIFTAKVFFMPPKKMNWLLFHLKLMRIEKIPNAAFEKFRI